MNYITSNLVQKKSAQQELLPTAREIFIAPRDVPDSDFAG